MLVISKDTVRLLRIPFSLFLVPVFLLALSQAPVVQPVPALIIFLIIHVLVYPASNGYNSYVDRDSTSIGGLEDPPQPTAELFRITLLLDLLAVLLACLLLNMVFGLLLALYIAASRVYSGAGLRLKRFPIAGFLTVVFFQGAYTAWLCMAGISGSITFPDTETLLLLAACSLQIAAAYPLTQVYQHQADGAAGVRTVSMVLGINGTFGFTLIMFILCNLCYLLYFTAIDELSSFFLLQAFNLPAVWFFSGWYLRVRRNASAANFHNTMRMNLISSLSNGLCFITLFLIR